MPNLVPVSLSLWAGLYNVLFAFLAGAEVILLSPFDTRRFAELVAEHGIRSVVLPPAALVMLTDDPAVTDLAPLRFVRSITAPLSPLQARRFHDAFGVAVLNSYGQTELGGEVVGWRGADAKEFGATKLGALGRPHEGVDVVVRDEDGRDLAVDEVGELCIRTPSTGRRRHEPALAGRVDEAGYLRTGDIGHVDPDGFLWLSGRVSDAVNRGGLKVFPGEVEEVLRLHPSVADVAVAGIPDDRLGEVPWAWIVPADPGPGTGGSDGSTGSVEAAALDPAAVDPAALDPAAVDPVALEAHCREHLVAYKVPAGFSAVEALPRNDVGKVVRRDLPPPR